MNDVMNSFQKTLVEKIERIMEIKEKGNVFYAYLDSFPQILELSIAKTKLEECVMSAVKGVCGSNVTS